MNKKRWGKRGIGEFNARMKSRDIHSKREKYTQSFLLRVKVALALHPASGQLLQIQSRMQRLMRDGANETRSQFFFSHDTFHHRNRVTNTHSLVVETRERNCPLPPSTSACRRTTITARKSHRPSAGDFPRATARSCVHRAS